MTRLNIRRTVQAVLVLGLFSVQDASAATIVLGEPANPQPGTETTSYYPFRHDSHLPGTNSAYQQVYRADRFPSAMSIRSVSFPVASFGFIDPTAFYLVRLFYTHLPVNGLTMNFDDNLGAGLASMAGPLNPTSAGFLLHAGALPAPSGGMLTLTASAPALYDTSNGNLLLDIRQLSGNSSNLEIRAMWYTYSADAVFSSAHDYGSGPYANFGLVTQFHEQSGSAPEPGTVALFACGVAGLALLGWRARRNTE